MTIHSMVLDEKNDHLWPYLEIRTQKSQHVERQGDTIEQITFPVNDQFKTYLLPLRKEKRNEKNQMLLINSFSSQHDAL